MTATATGARPTISQGLLSEFTHEMAGLRRTLERVPEDRAGWTPHPKSMTLGALAAHCAEMVGWVAPTVTQDGIDLTGYVPAAFESTAATLAMFDRNLAAASAALAAAPDDGMMAPWAMTKNGHTIMQMPRLVVLRSMVFNHLVHHRAQLGLYLRLLDVPVPALYGPSADEGR